MALPINRSIQITLVLACIGLIFKPSAFAQPPAVRLQMSPTLRDALQRSGFDEAASKAGAPDLDRRLTSSAFGVSEILFVAGYYFADELTGDGGLGPLHLGSYSRTTARWVERPPSDDHLGGSVTGIQIAGDHILIGLHLTPSAQTSLVLDRRTLEMVASIAGGGLQALPDGSIRFVGNMVHFASTHQERLFIFDPKSRREVEICPSPKESSAATSYRRTLRSAYGRLPSSTRAEYEKTSYGPVSDFDRSIVLVRDHPNGGRMAFVVIYDSVRFSVESAPDPLETIVRCDRRAIGTWICEERPVAQRAREAGLSVTWDASGRVSQDALDQLLAAVLRKP